MSKRRLLFGIGILLGGFALVRFSGFVHFVFFPNQPHATEKTAFLIKKGSLPPSLARDLKSQGVVSSARRFLRLGQFLGKWPEVKAGEYALSPAMTPLEIFEILTSGVSVSHTVTVQEGKNMYQIGEILEQKGLASKEEFVSLCEDPKLIGQLQIANPPPHTLEGYLFPETYFLNRTMKPKEIIQQMVQRFQTVWTDDYQSRASELGFSKHQIITLASIIEKETGAPEERPLISSVFHNRLRKRMRLQSDPTTIYGMWERYKGNIRRSDLKEKNDFNTYMIKALPIGPIANPGKEAIQAALHPDKSSFLYFVSRNDGTHVFTKNFADHNRAVQDFQVNRKARQGKSWRDLQKKRKPTRSGAGE